MRTSIEKIHELAREYSTPNPEGEGIEMLISTAVMTIGPSFISMLPDDPAQLDAIIESIATQLLELRSDGARQLVLAADVEGDWKPIIAGELPAGEQAPA